METAEHRDPYESRGSRTDLGAPGGENPPGDSTENAVLQPADTGRVARAFRAARDRQAVPQGPHRRLRESRRHQVRIGLFAGGGWIRTSGTADDARLLADLYAHNASR